MSKLRVAARTRRHGVRQPCPHTPWRWHEPPQRHPSMQSLAAARMLLLLPPAHSGTASGCAEWPGLRPSAAPGGAAGREDSEEHRLPMGIGRHSCCWQGCLAGRHPDCGKARGNEEQAWAAVAAALASGGRGAGPLPTCSVNFSLGAQVTT